jgi:heat shock protein HslJ
LLPGVLIAAAVLAGCGSDGADVDADQPTSLDGRVFLSQSVDGHTLVSGTQIRLTFDGGELGASAGCNSLGAPYRLVEGRIVVRGDMVMTEMGCDPPRHAQDEWLADLLRSEPRAVIDGSELSLIAGDVTVHLLDREVADPDRPLTETRWRVDTVLRGDAASSVPDEPPVTLELRPSGTLVLTSDGCTSAEVDVDVDEASATLRFGELTIDSIGCPPPWDAVVELVREGEASYSIEAARLAVTAGDVGIGAVALAVA